VTAMSKTTNRLSTYVDRLISALAEADQEDIVYHAGRVKRAVQEIEQSAQKALLIASSTHEDHQHLSPSLNLHSLLR
jgi:hypothetical protein